MSITVNYKIDDIYVLESLYIETIVLKPFFIGLKFFVALLINIRFPSLRTVIIISIKELKSLKAIF